MPLLRYVPMPYCQQCGSPCEANQPCRCSSAPAPERKSLLGRLLLVFGSIGILFLFAFVGGFYLLARQADRQLSIPRQAALDRTCGTDIQLSMHDWRDRDCNLPVKKLE